MYYSNYESLFKHFSISHYVCTVKECINKHFVAFKTKAELEHHHYKKHNTEQSKSTKYKIQQFEEES